MATSRNSKSQSSQGNETTPTSSDEKKNNDVETEKDVQAKDTETVNDEDTKAGVKSIGAPSEDEKAAEKAEDAAAAAVAIEGANVPENAASGLAAGNDAAWVADGYGNPAAATYPARPLVGGRQFYPFEYRNNENGTITSTETVYMVVNYPGSKRLGRSLAYTTGTMLSADILNAVVTVD